MEVFFFSKFVVNRNLVPTVCNVHKVMNFSGYTTLCHSNPEYSWGKKKRKIHLCLQVSYW